MRRPDATHDGAGRGVPVGVHAELARPAASLDGATRTFFEQRFGHDFSTVRVHADASAADSARSVGAQAYTVGDDLVFGAGRYAPATREGRHLLAHELTHVVQQRAGASRGLQAKGGGDDAHEREADEIADKVAGDKKPGPKRDKAPDKKPEKKPDKKPDKKAEEKNPCTRTIFAEGSCQDLVNGSAFRCCDPKGGLENKDKSKDIDGVDCPSHKFTPIFTCDSNCNNALKKGCSDSDNWMAVPRNQFTRAQCGDVWTICANGRTTTGYVRDQSVTKRRFEVSPGIQRALGVTPGSSFLGSVYTPGASQNAIDKDRCCKAPPPKTPPPKKGAAGGAPHAAIDSLQDAES